MASNENTDDSIDPRFSVKLFVEVLDVLDRHGYRRGQNSKSTADALMALLELTRAYEGSR